MRARAVLFVSVLLVECQAFKHDGTVEQRAQSLFAAGQGEVGKFTSQAHWLDGGTFYAQDQDLQASIGDELRMGTPDNPRIREQKRKYLRNKSYLRDVTLWAEPCMYWIAGQAKKYNMSMELVLLPIVESAFDPHVTSGANAADIWQTIPSTGRSYGLKQTHSYDARRDIVASTTAAPDMMQRLDEMFDGDWLLTVAAYSSSEGRVTKAVKANRSCGKPADFWSLSLPRETKIYVPKTLTSSDTLKNSKRYDVKLPTADESRALARVRLDSPVDTSQLTDMARMPVNKLKTFNADVKGSMLGASGLKYVMVPQKHVAQLRESLASGDIVAVQPTQLTDSTPLISRSYKVRSSDTISGVASRLGVMTRDLQQWDNLRGSGLKVGQSLAVGTGSNAQRLANNSDSITYRVRKGDSLSNIVKRHGVNICGAMCWNSDTDSLWPGDQLTPSVKNSDRPES